MSNQNERSEALFQELSKNKKKKKRKTLRTVLIVILVIAVALAAGFNYLRQQVEDRFASMADNVLSYEASLGTISTTVNSSGMLEEMDLHTIEVPSGVEITGILVEANDLVSQGDVLATVDMASLMDAMSGVQSQIDSLDRQIEAADSDSVSGEINAGVSGRVKILYAEKGDDVTRCMAEHGALAVLSLDGYMAVEIETDALAVGDSVTVIRAEGKEISGTVEKVTEGAATVLVTDKGPEYDEKVTVLSEDGTELGSGMLYIHSPLAVTGYAGTVTNVYVDENDWVESYTWLFYLEDSGFSANYDTLLRQREEQEELLMELLFLYRDGAVIVPMDGLVSSVSYGNEDAGNGIPGAGETAAADTELLTLYPNISMRVTIGIDEMDILALQVGQEADITVSSVSEDVYAGIVTEINTSADQATGMSQYSAVVELPKQEGMLPGMTADVDVKIQGVEDAIIIPVEALHQTSAIYYVYTSYDAETMQYGGMVEVTIGMQNSSFVEITSGLNEGDTVYYTEEQNFFFPGMGGFGGMTGGNGSGNGGFSGFGGENSGNSGNGGFGGFGGLGGR